ncbi:MAG: AMP-binding protein [Acidimicrobiales bacterium]
MIERVDDAGIADAGTLLRRAADLHPDREAFIEAEVRLTFAAWDRAADAVAAQFASHGVGHGDVVALVMGSSADFAVCYQAAMRLGAITSALNPRLGSREVASIFERTRPRVTVLDPGVASLPPGLPTGTVIDRDDVRRAVEAGGRPVTFPTVAADDVVAIVWTSGTTGAPKGAVFDHACLRDMARGAGVLSVPGDRRLSPIPFAHVGYMTRPWDEIVNVITTVIAPSPWHAADHLRLIAEESITVGQGVPTQWQLVLQHPDLTSTDTSSLRITSTGSSRVPAELVRAMRKAFGVPVVVRYTSTEASVSTGTQIDDDDEVIANTVGRPAPNVELRVAVDGRDAGVEEVGAVLLRSRAQMRGYWKDPDMTAAVIGPDGWLDTGDLGWLDGAGNLSIVGRRVEMYIRGGYNVYPAEVEEVLGEHPAVARAAVVGIPDPVMGQIGAAAVIPSDPERPPTLDELRAWCRDRLASYKAPDRLRVVAELPTNAMTKVVKAGVAALFEPEVADG